MLKDKVDMVTGKFDMLKVKINEIDKALQDIISDRSTEQGAIKVMRQQLRW